MEVLNTVNRLRTRGLGLGLVKFSVFGHLCSFTIDLTCSLLLWYQESLISNPTKQLHFSRISLTSFTFVGVWRILSSLYI